MSWAGCPDILCAPRLECLLPEDLSKVGFLGNGCRQTNSPTLKEVRSLSENRRGLADFAQSSEQSVPVPFVPQVFA